MTDFLEQWANQSEANTRLVAQELLITEVTEEIWKAMEEAGVTKAELANRMGATKGYVSQVLSGSRNMTLRTLADICFALGHKPVICLDINSLPEERAPQVQKTISRHHPEVSVALTRVG